MFYRLKKTAAFLLAAAGLCGLIPAHAELPDLTGLWEDPGFDRAEFVILHDFDLWTDERLGEEPDGSYVITMTETGSAMRTDCMFPLPATSRKCWKTWGRAALR